MASERLWAPWRMAFIRGEDLPEVPEEELSFLPGADPSCFFCQGVVSQFSKERFVVYRNDTTIAVLNRYPYNNGHVMVAPRRHVGSLSELTPDERMDQMALLTRMVEILAESMRPEGFNVGANLGRVAGAGVPGHLHWHIVPRWNGDTNFMPGSGRYQSPPPIAGSLVGTVGSGAGQRLIFSRNHNHGSVDSSIYISARRAGTGSQPSGSAADADSR